MSDEKKTAPTATPAESEAPVLLAESAGEAAMSLAHAQFVAAARLRADMDGHLSKAMQFKLNDNVAAAGARYVRALDAFEAANS